MSLISEESWEAVFQILRIKRIPFGSLLHKRQAGGSLAQRGNNRVYDRTPSECEKEREDSLFDKSHFGCPGGAYYMGFFESPMPNIEYFLSCGIRGKWRENGILRHIRTGERILRKMIPRRAPATYCVFKPIDQFERGKEPEVVIFLLRRTFSQASSR